MYQLRTYTLKTAAVLERYATVHWPRHISSLRAFGVITHGPPSRGLEPCPASRSMRGR
jgi:hypothetical protein